MSEVLPFDQVANMIVVMLLQVYSYPVYVVESLLRQERSFLCLYLDLSRVLLGFLDSFLVLVFYRN